MFLDWQLRCFCPFREDTMSSEARDKEMKRREFLKKASTVTAAVGASIGTFSIFKRKSYARDLLDDPRVVVVRDDQAHSGTQINQDIVQVMMDEAIRRYTGISDIGAAYQSTMPSITTNSVIGIKVNSRHSTCPTHPVMVESLINGLLRMNIGGDPFPDNNIIIWDNSSSELQNSGFTINIGSSGVRCIGTNMVGYNSMYLNCNGSNQHPSNILTDYCDYLINFAVLKNHGIAGVTVTLKNHFGSIHNPSGMHGNFCDPYIPSLNQQISNVLTVQECLFFIDAIFGVYYGGPYGSPNMIYDGVIMGGDRVAVDAVGRSILADYGCTTISIATHVDTAAGAPYFLGTADLTAIDRMNVQNPSIAVMNLTVEPADQDMLLSWSTPEYTGLIKVLRSTDPDFATYDEIATLNGNSYIDSGILASNTKYFYRVVKSWA